jgi:hypothetical protein
MNKASTLIRMIADDMECWDENKEIKITVVRRDADNIPIEVTTYPVERVYRGEIKVEASRGVTVPFHNYCFDERDANI